jgi:hypothetical protein
LISEHDRLQAMLADLHAQRPPYRPPIRPWRFMAIGEAILVPTQGAARAGARWVRKYGWILSRKKQRDGSGWLVRRIT